MQDRPSAAELLAAVADTLAEDVMPATEGAVRHQVRVAANLCRILRRELEQGDGQEREARRALAGLLGGPERPSSEGLVELVRRLDGSDPGLEDRAWPVLLGLVRAKLAVARPGYDTWDGDAEPEP